MILEDRSYVSAIEEIMKDNTKFSKLNIPSGQEINHIVNFGKRITSERKLLKNKENIDKSCCKGFFFFFNFGFTPCKAEQPLRAMDL